MTETWWVIAALILGTFAIRLGGVLIGNRLPREGAWARALNALPGSLIIALVGVLILSGGWVEWIAGVVALAIAIMSRSLLLTMAAGIIGVWALRQFV